MNSTQSLPKKEHMPGWAYRLMTWSWKIKDLFSNPSARLNEFGIEPGWTVIDYGCGPGRYVRQASQLVGQDGWVYAVDIHELAMQCLKRVKQKYHLKNVRPVKADGYFAPIPEDIADLIYILDAFHQISDHREFLHEIHRLIKHHGKVILEDGHQPRKKTLQKVSDTPEWKIQEEHRKYLVLVPRWKLMPEVSH